MVAGAVEESAHEEEEQVERAAVFCFEHAAYDVVGERTAEGVGAAGREDADVRAGSTGLLLNGDESGVGVLENEGADETKRKLRMGRFGSRKVGG